MELFIFILVYIAPWLIAGIRGHYSRHAILVLNIIFGWTIIGWIWALLWALNGNTPKAAV